MAATPALAATQKEVQNFWQQLHDARSTQQQSMSTTGSGSDDVEAARLAMCDAMFEDLGSIMAHFAKDRGRIGGFFDLENIRHHEQAIFKRIVKAATTLFILKHTFTAADTLTFTNNSAVALFFWLAANKMVSFDEKASIMVPPNSVATVTAASMGAPENAYLFVHNADAATGGDCTIELQ